MTDTKDFNFEKEDQVFMVEMQDIDEELGIETTNPDMENLDPDLKEILEEYKQIFRDTLPQESPDKRDVTHYIKLKEGAQPRKAT